MKKHIIAVTNVRGGAGKTVTVGALSQAAARDGKKVLVIDSDPQCNLSYWYDVESSDNTIMYAFTDQNLNEAIHETDFGVDIIPGTGDLITIKTGRHSAERLQKAIKPLKKKYDFIIIDTPPGMGEVMNNDIFAADEIIIPCTTDIMSVKGLYTISDIINQARRTKPNLSVLGVLVTMYDRRSRINREMYEMLEEAASECGFHGLGKIRTSVKVREAVARRESIYDHALNCTAAEDYQNLYYEIVGGVKNDTV